MNNVLVDPRFVEALEDAALDPKQGTVESVITHASTVWTISFPECVAFVSDAMGDIRVWFQQTHDGRCYPPENCPGCSHS